MFKTSCRPLRAGGVWTQLSAPNWLRPLTSNLQLGQRALRVSHSFDVKSPEQTQRDRGTHRITQLSSSLLVCFDVRTPDECLTGQWWCWCWGRGCSCSCPRLHSAAPEHHTRSGIIAAPPFPLCVAFMTEIVTIQKRAVQAVSIQTVTLFLFFRQQFTNTNRINPSSSGTKFYGLMEQKLTSVLTKE